MNNDDQNLTMALSCRIKLGLLCLAVVYPLSGLAGPPSKVEICHIPPDDPVNVHIIKISEKAAGKHAQNHGDLNLSSLHNEGSMDGVLCDDGIDNDCDGLIDGDDGDCGRDYRYVFVSAERYTGDLGASLDAGNEVGLAAGDAICNTLAANAVADGNALLAGHKPFTAWLSDSGTNAIDRVDLANVQHEYRLLDDTVVFDSQNTGGPTYAPYTLINVDQHADLVVAADVLDNFVWTGTNNLGDIAGNDCLGWSYGLGDAFGVFGGIDQALNPCSTGKSSCWTGATSGGSKNTICSAPSRLYCFENQ